MNLHSKVNLLMKQKSTMQLKLLPNIDSPADIRGFSMDELERLVDEIRFHTIDIVSQVGGAFGTNTWSDRIVCCIT